LIIQIIAFIYGPQAVRNKILAVRARGGFTVKLIKLKLRAPLLHGTLPKLCHMFLNNLQK